MKFNCLYCNSVLPFHKKYENYCKCEKCNVLYYHNCFGLEFEYLLSSKYLFKYENRYKLYGEQIFMLNDKNKLPLYYVCKCHSSVDIKLINIVYDHFGFKNSILNIDDSLLESINPSNIDQKIKIILTLM